MTGVDIFSYLQEISVIVEIHYKIALYLMMSFEDYFESLVCVCHISTPTMRLLIKMLNHSKKLNIQPPYFRTSTNLLCSSKEFC